MKDETLKKNIEETFTQIKNAINEREKEMLSKVDDIINDKNGDLFSSERKKYEPTYKEIGKLVINQEKWMTIGIIQIKQS